MAVEDVHNLNGPALANGSAPAVEVASAPYAIKPSEFRVRRFEESVMNHNVAVEVMKMKDSVYIWAGSASHNSQGEGVCTRVRKIVSLFDKWELVPT